MTVSICAPVDGKVIELSSVADPVFAQGMMGPGIAIIPDDRLDNRSESDSSDVLPAVAGHIIKVLPHAFIVQAKPGLSVLIHLGIDTFKNDVHAFTSHLNQGDVVSESTVAISWQPHVLHAKNIDATVIVVALECRPHDVTFEVTPGTHVKQGDELFKVRTR